MYELMGRAHAALIRGERGQGTVEYVGLILLIGVVLDGGRRGGARRPVTRTSHRRSSAS